MDDSIIGCKCSSDMSPPGIQSVTHFSGTYDTLFAKDR